MQKAPSGTNDWTEELLEQLPKEGVFRLRGLEVTRLDTFVDAAFAFVLTLLVISFDDIPSDYSEMIETIKRIPGFFLSFCMVMVFWVTHRHWSRRFGLENKLTLLLSLAIIFEILVYVYPLRMLFETLMHWLSNGFFSSTFQISSSSDIRSMFLYYSSGFACMALLFVLLLWTTLAKSKQLCLSTEELFETKLEMRVWLLLLISGGVSIIVTLLVTDRLIPLAGFVYMAIPPCVWAMSAYMRKSQ